MLLEPPPTREDPTPPWWSYLDPVSNLSTRYAMVFAAAGVAFTFIVCWIAGALMERHIQNTFGLRLETLAFQISDKLDRGMFERYRELQLVAGQGPIRDPAGSPAERRLILAAVQDTLPEYAWVGMTDPAGIVTAASRGWLEGTDAKDLAWFDRAQEKPFAGSLHPLPELAELLPGAMDEKPRFISVSSPVFAPSTKFVGVVGAYISWDWVRRAVASVVPEGLGADRTMVTIYDLDGRVLLDSHQVARINQTAVLSLPVVPEAHKYRGSMVEEAVDGTYLTGYVRSRGYQAFHYLNWFFAVRQPAAMAFAPVEVLQRNIILIGFSASAALGVVGWIFALRMTRRFRAISAASDRIREGDISSLVPAFKDEDEFTRMTDSFGRMVQDLRERNAALDEEVAALRQRLKGKLEEAAPPPPAALSRDEEDRALNPTIRPTRLRDLKKPGG